MSDTSDKTAAQLPENVIPLFRNEWSYHEQHGGHAPEAFRIRCREIYYLSILFPGDETGVQGQGFAAFKNGEQIRFTINGNGDENTRERCIKAGERIAMTFQATLEHGTISHQGRFLPAAAR